jgi:hypothetical protein
MVAKSKREEVVELVNKLFVYTDSRQWSKLLKEVFAVNVQFDMSSMGAGSAKELTAQSICDMWNGGFEGLDYIHHQAGNYIVDFKSDDTDADVLCYATASHYRKAAIHGKTREFIGSYKIHASFTDLGWRIDGFTYHLKYVSGNEELK